MNYQETIQAAGDNAQQLEILYQAARHAGEASAFATAIHGAHRNVPAHLLYAAWHYRLADWPVTLESRTPERGNNIWLIAIPLSLACGLLFWLLSFDFDQPVFNDFPLLAFVWTPLCALFVLALFALVNRRFAGHGLWLGLGLALIIVYAVQIAPFLRDNRLRQDYTILAVLHLPALAWGVVGAYLLWSQSGPYQRFAFLIKSLEVIITGGLFAAAGGVFTAIALGLFEALQVEIPDPVMRLFFVGGAGLIPVLAVATVYNPEASPLAQSFTQGLSKLIATLMRLLLPLTLLVLGIYLCFIPFNFMAPFENRDLLTVYNAMLFAIMGLLIGATPVQVDDLTPALRTWLRRALIAVAVLAVIISLYASAAILYRTWQGGLTPNRFTIIGWNGANIAILLILLVKQARSNAQTWLPAMYATVSIGAMIYLIWALSVIVVTPWLNFFLTACLPTVRC